MSDTYKYKATVSLPNGGIGEHMQEVTVTANNACEARLKLIAMYGKVVGGPTQIYEARSYKNW